MMTHIKHVELESVRMTAGSWSDFIASFRHIQNGFDIELWYTNIDNESVSTVHTSPHFKVTQNV